MISGTNVCPSLQSCCFGSYKAFSSCTLSFGRLLFNKRVCLCACASLILMGGKKKKRGNLLTLPSFVSVCEIQLQPAAQIQIQLSLHHRPDWHGRNSIFAIFKNWSIQAAKVLCFPLKSCLWFHSAPASWCLVIQASACWHWMKTLSCLPTWHTRPTRVTWQQRRIVGTRQLRGPSVMQMRLRLRCELRKRTCITAAASVAVVAKKKKKKRASASQHLLQPTSSEHTVNSSVHVHVDSVGTWSGLLLWP